MAVVSRVPLSPELTLGGHVAQARYKPLLFQAIENWGLFVTEALLYVCPTYWRSNTDLLINYIIIIVAGMQKKSQIDACVEKVSWGSNSSLKITHF